MKNFIKLFTFILSAAAFLIISKTDVMAAEAAPVNITITSSDNVKISNMTDDSYYTSCNFSSGSSITISSDETFYGLYITWNQNVSAWTLEYNGSTLICGNNGFLHEYIPIKGGTSSCVIKLSADASICNLAAYSQGELPSSVQVWEAPCDNNTDILVFSTHADDEILFLGGILATYGGNQNLNVQIAYLCDFFYTESYREHEKLDGLWEAGIRHYPVKGSFKDIGSRSLELAMNQYNYDDVLSYVTGCIRRFKPLVAVTQDLNGEYGHGGHMLFAKAVYDAVGISADNSYYPDSASQYGIWDVPKTYFHLYPENQIKLNLSVPLSNMGGRNAIQVAQDAYDKHVSQHKWDFAITDSGNATTGNAAYSCSTFGLYRSLVGADTGNDMLENVTTYEEQERLTKERMEKESIEQASVEASVEASIAEEYNNSHNSSDNTSKGGSPVRLIINIIAIIIVAAVIILQFNRTKNLYNKKYNENKDEFQKDQK